MYRKLMIPCKGKGISAPYYCNLDNFMKIGVADSIHIQSLTILEIHTYIYKIIIVYVFSLTRQYLRRLRQIYWLAMHCKKIKILNYSKSTQYCTYY